MSKSIYILHLSDLHIDPVNLEQGSQLFADLCIYLNKFFTRRECSLDLLLVSGDLLQARANNYQPVSQILKQICRASGLDNEHIFMVPGNHDVNRQNCKDPYWKAVNNLIKHCNIDALKEDQRDSLNGGFDSYLNFAKNYGPPQKTEHSLPGYAHADLEINKVKLRLCGLNSALIAGPNDSNKSEEERKNRVVSIRLLGEMLQNTEGLNLVVSHYPVEWIHPSQQAQMRNMLQQSNAIYFHGHRHKPVAKRSGLREQMISLGAGDIYGGDWNGAKHCQILEFNFNCSKPLLREWFWFPDIGWRFFEPIAISWDAWETRREHLGFCKGVRNQADLGSTCHQLGLISMGQSREEDERLEYFRRALDCADEGSEFIIVGRSLVDWSLLYKKISRVIYEKKLNFKIALLDENKIEEIAQPDPGDWAGNDVRASMERFKRIAVQEESGSLEIYGLPFYVPRSFISFTNQYDKKRYCLEEVGMGILKDARPFFEMRSIDGTSLGHIIEQMHKSSMIPERLLLSDYGKGKRPGASIEKKVNIADKARKLGLVDLAIGLGNLEWIPTKLDTWILNARHGSEIFIVGRTCSLVTYYYKELATAIIDNCIQCTIVIANPEQELKSLVKYDNAPNDLPICWNKFNEALLPALKSKAQGKSQIGTFKLYGIPAYVPSTFSSYYTEDGVPFCTLEPGIAVEPSERPCLCFRKVSDSDEDIYSKLMKIYRGIIDEREPIIQFPEKVSNS